MSYEKSEARKASRRRWYEKNKEYSIARSKEQYQRNKEKWQEFKASQECLFCGASHPAIIDFHHPDSDGAEKVGSLVSKGSLKKAFEEAQNCIPLCANCHRIYHWTERQ